MLKGFAILLSLHFFGELIRSLLNLPLPGPVIGMVLLVVALQFDVVQLDEVEPSSRLLLENLGLLFVPIGVGLTLYRKILQANWVSISVSIVVSTLLTLLVTGKVVQRLETGNHERKEISQ